MDKLILKCFFTFFFGLIFWNLMVVESVNIVHLTSVRCNNSLSKTVVNTTCSLKSFKHNIVAMNMETFLTREFKGNKFQVHYQVNSKKKDSNTYHKLYEIKYDNLCNVLGLKGGIFDELRNVLDASAPGIFVPCPWKAGRLALVNKTFSEHHSSKIKKEMTVPTGDYRATFKLWDQLDDNAFSLGWSYQLKTHL